MSEDTKVLLGKALGELRRLKQEMKALKSSGGEPIAIVGMACQFPGGCIDPEAYWDFLASGSSAVRPTPPDRAEGTAGGFGSYLDNTDQFDAAFFGISPKEAQSMDPQQRLLLELAWHAFESGNIRPDSWAGREVGVFVGMSGIDYALKLFAASNRDRIDPYFGTGSTLSPAAGRLAYYYKLNGPTMVLDTACSSSLVAIHLAVQSLRRGECEAALTAGVNRILGPDLTLNFDQSGLLAPDGKCYTFDARAKGYCRGEGGGMLILKRLSDAEAAGDKIFALILGSAVNQDGGSSGLTVPSGPAQQKVIRRALQSAGLTPDQVDYVEAHGTATPLGDPIEANALSEVFSVGRAADRPLWLGSVKTNLGHLEAAAGMASSFKVIQSLRQEALPQHLNFSEPSPHIDWKGSALSVVDSLQPWPRGERRRVAGVSGFGFVGTNAHIIFAEAPVRSTSALPEAKPEAELFVLSARTPEALRAQAKAAAARFSSLPLSDWAGATYAARAGRTAFAERLSLVAGTPQAAATILDKFAESGKARGLGLGRVGERPRSAFVFTGQGSQYAGMGRRLYAQLPLFREIIDTCAAKLLEPLGRDLREVMFAETPALEVEAAASASVFDGARNAAPLADIDRTSFTQAGLFVIEYALARVWESLGVRAELVLGHSVGEYAAACIAGVFSLDDALKLIVARGRLMEQRSAPGAMLTVFADEAVVAKLIEPLKATVAIAAVNGPEILLVSGATESIAKVHKLCEQAQIRVVAMRISHAFHSPLTEPILAELEAVAGSLTLNRPKLRLISNLTGGFVDQEVTRPDYWSRHLRQSVRFCDSMILLHAQKFDYLIEVGPEPTLIGLDLAFQLARSESVTVAKWIPSLRRGHDDLSTMLDGAGRLWTSGLDLTWSSIGAAIPAAHVSLPGYAFQRKRHWFNFADPVLPSPTAMTSSVVSHAVSEATPKVVAAPVPARLNAQAILVEVQAIIGEVSGLEPADLTAAANLLEMGLDSLMFVRSGRMLEKRFQVKISIKQFYEELHRIGALVDFLVANSTVNTLVPDSVLGEVGPGVLPVPNIAPVTSQILAVPQSLAGMPPATVVAPMAVGLDPIMEAHFRLMERYLAMQVRGPVSAVATPPAANPVSAAAPAVLPAMNSKMAVNFGGLNLEEEKNLSIQQKEFLRALTERLAAKTGKSKNQTQAWRRELADWKGSLQFKRSLKELKYPIISDRSSGSRLWDLDGNEYVDLALGMGVHFLGHAPTFVNEALHRQIDRSAALGPQSDLAGEVAKKICQLTGAERASLAITGSGAVLLAQRLARAAQGRPLIAQFAGAYHGIGSEVLVVGGEEGSRPMSPGIPPSVVQNAQVLDYGSEESLEWIREHAAQLAAVIVEPVQSRRPGFQPHRFLRRLRKLTSDLGIVLIFDEMINGFRIHGGGAQAWFGIQADLITYGKIVGGGMPLAVVAGKAWLMDWIDGGFWQFGDNSAPAARTIFTGGTHNRHPLALAAAGAALDYLITEGPALHQRVNRLTDRLGKELNEFFERESVSFRVSWFGSQFRFDALGDTFDLEVMFYLLTEMGFYTWEQRICCLSTEHTDEQIDRLIEAVRTAVAQMRAGGFAILAGPRAPRRVLPLSSVQQRLYALCQREGAEMPYHLSGVWEMRGGVDVFKLQDSFQEIIRRHESLRTAFGLIGGKLRQYVIEEPRFFLQEVKMDGKTPAALLQEFIAPFDLEQPPLLRVGYAVVDAERTLLLIDVHHIAADGLSMNVILTEFARLYDGLALGPVKRQYRHAIEEIEGRRQLPEYRAEEVYWLKEMSGEIPKLDLPADFLRSAEMDFRGDKCGLSIDADRTRRLEILAREHGASLYMVLLGAYVTLLHRLSGAEDLIVGLPVAGRPGADSDEVVGMFVNSLPLRFYPTAELPFADLLRAVRSTCLGAYDHAEYAFAELVEKLNLPRNPDRSPVFDTMFAYESADDRVMRTRELEIRTIDQFEGSGMFDLSVDIIRERGVLGIRFHYATRLFRRETVERFCTDFGQLIDSLLENPHRPLGRLPMLSPADRLQVMTDFNAVAGAVSDPTTLISLWSASAQQYASSVGLVCGDRRFTFQTMDAQAEAVARRLSRDHGVARGDCVALLLESSDATMIAILGVLKTGAAYVPIDIANPAERVRALVADSGARILLVDVPFEGMDPGAKIIEFETLRAPAPADYPSPQPPAPQTLAYVIYTSGSTGKPKGVMIEHGAIANSVLWRMHAYSLTSADVTQVMPTYAFDAFLLDAFPTLFSGGRLVMASAAEKSELMGQSNRLQREKISNLLLTPSLHSLYLDEIAISMKGLKWVTVAGEATSLSLVRKHFKVLPGVRLFNEYGPTENSVVTTFTELFASDEAVTIGRPVAGHQLFIIQSNGEICGVAQPGELVVSGAGLARGYLNRPELTASAFTPAPWNPSLRIYRTGDLARWRPDGALDFLGRRDGQVKLRGYRIELTEIEEALRGQPCITSAAVKLAPIGGEPQLIAYVATRNGYAEAVVRAALQELLPLYMVPSLFVRLETMPLNSSGKIDSKALLVPNFAPSPESGGPAQGAREEALAQVWSEILRQPNISRNADYFRLGGDSIKGIQIISRLRQIGWRLDMRWLFRYPTVAGLAPRLEPARSAVEPSAPESIGELPTGPIQKWFFQNITQQPEHFNQAIWLDAREPWKIDAMQSALRQVVAHHDAFRYRFTLEGEKWRQYCTMSTPALACRVLDLRRTESVKKALDEMVLSEQRALDLSEGPLTRAVLVQLETGDRLFWTAHHLVVDGISWRILLEDLAAAYAAAIEKKPPARAARTATFGRWTRTVGVAVSGGLLQDEVNYWEALAQRSAPNLPYDLNESSGTVADLRMVEVTLDTAVSAHLSKHAHAPYKTRGIELLVSALRIAYAEWNPGESLRLLLEGHGRESALADLDIGRTVGWFTSVYPADFAPVNANLSGAGFIRQTKEYLRGVPRHGAGFGWLQATGANVALSGLVSPDISFNYLGSFEDGGREAAFTLSAERPIESRHFGQRLEQSIALTGYTSGGQMHWLIEYDAARWSEKTMRKLLELFRHALGQIVAHTSVGQQSIPSPADFVFSTLELQAYDRMVERREWAPSSIEDVYPLSPMQRGLFYEATKSPDSEAYFEQMTFCLEGPVDRLALEAAWRDLVARHAALRSVFVQAEGSDETLQVVFHEQKTALAYASLIDQTAAEQTAHVAAFQRADRAALFSLEYGPLMRVQMFQLEQERLQLVWSHHHILMDGWCVGILYEDLMRCYAARLKGLEPKLEAAADYRVYLRWLETLDVSASTAFWRQELAGYERRVSLPRQHVVGAGDYDCRKAKMRLDNEAWAQLQKLATEQGATTATLLNTLWGILLSRYNQVDDVVFGGIVSGRSESVPDVENMVGLFINVLPVRLKFSADLTFLDALRQFQAQAIERRPHEYLSLVQVAEQVEDVRELFDHLVVLENYPMDEELRGDGQKTMTPRPRLAQIEGFERTHLDFTLVAVPRSAALEIEMTFNAAVYSEQQIQRVQAHLLELVAALALRPDSACSVVDFLPAAERGLLETWNRTSARYPTEATLHGLFAEQVRLHAKRPAVTAEGKTLTYKQTDIAARLLAGQLIQAGVGIGDRVAIWLPRGTDMVVSLLATIMAGGCYVPLDPEYPEERLRFILEDSGARIVVSHSDHRSPFTSLPELCIDKVSIAPASITLPQVTPDTPAYIIYTSGSTGKPKGCLISHRNVVRLLRNDRFDFKFGPEDVWVVAHSFCFDFSVWEMYGALTYGGRVVVAPREVVRDVSSFVDLVMAERITVLNQTPAAFYAFLAEALKRKAHDFSSHLRYVIFGGDRLEVRYLSDWADRYGASQPELINMYGITETTVHVTFHPVTMAEIRSGDGRSVIGRPLPETEVWVLDAQRRLMPVGMVGELYVGGTGVGLGYLNRPELTAERFQLDASGTGQRWYRTGDMGRWRDDGVLEYLGRNDHQVQVRGFRVELGEVEAACLAQNEIQQAVVLPHEETAGQFELVAYLVGTTRAASELRAALLVRLPQYMVPTYFEWVSAIPLTPNGKIDRKALPRPGSGAEAPRVSIAPRNPTEHALLALWHEVLGISNIGIHDNFFDLGGQSLKAVRLRSKIESTLNVALSLRDLFARPTIAELAAAVIEAGGGDATASKFNSNLEEVMKEFSAEQIEAQLRKFQL